ncbi:MAG: DNA topoisomerase 4 subunit A [Streptosporangiales bacterium]|nr:DNA topoisomerase 4 subunit A [Streptosporangiales bacterium]
MPRRRSSTPPPPEDFEERIVDIDVSSEMRESYLEYAYSVIYSRALPDARDGLKPVQRRILYQMREMGLRPDRGHVKCGRVVGDVMGKLHPHGDSAIYDTLVRMAQAFTMRLPLVDGHGNFGSLDDGPAAYRYTECRPAEPAAAMTDDLDEDVVDFRPNYDGQLTEPEVLPAAIPNLLVNGAAGIAVGMATNMPPHNLGEVVAACRHLIDHPDATLDDLMRFVPGPDLPSGGKIVGLDGIREAYESGRGTFRMRATARVDNVTPRRKGIVVTELPLSVGPEKVKERIGDLVRSKRLAGIHDVQDYTDRTQGMRLVIEIKGGFNPDAVLEQLYRHTQLEDSYGINNVTLVDGQPRTLGLRDMIQVFVEHRFDVVRRRTAFRRTKREERLHLVDGLLVALLDIDEVIQVIRGSDNTAAAKERLMQIFDLSEIQVQYILDTPLRRLTRFDRLELEKEGEDLRREIAELTAILESEDELRRVVSTELADVAKRYATPRRTVLLESAGQPAATTPLEVTDDPCLVLLSSTGLLARTTTTDPLPREGGRAKHDVLTSCVTATARGEVGAVTNDGRLVRISVVDLPALPPSASTPSLSGGAPLREFVSLERRERVVGLTSLVGGGAGLAVGTAQGIVKRVSPDYPGNRDGFDVISLKDGDHVVGVVDLASDDAELCFVTSDAQVLHFPASGVRPQGRAAGGIAGVRLSPSAKVSWFGAIEPGTDAVVVTIAGPSDALPGTVPGAAKVTPFDEYPAKGRGTGGVRCHRFLKGEDTLLVGWAGAAPPRAAAASGVAVDLPTEHGRRDGSGTALKNAVAAIG